MARLIVFHFEQVFGDQNLWFTFYDGRNWSPQGQAPIFARSATAPSAVVTPQNKIYVFHQGVGPDGPNGELVYTAFDGTNWLPGLKVLNVGISGSPSAVLWSIGIAVFYQGAYENGQLWYSITDGTNWPQSTQVPNVGMSGSPSAVVWNGRIHVFHQGSYDNGELLYSYLGDSGWSPDTRVPDVAVSGSPSAVVYNNQLYVFSGSDSLWYNVFDGTNWLPNKQVPNVALMDSGFGCVVF